MQTIMTNRAETRSISVAASPAALLDVVGDPRRLPDWAPDFAPAIAPDGRLWRIESGGGHFNIDVRVSRAHGTVDLLSATDPARGAFTRVVPNAGGSEYLFTLFFAAGTDEAAVAAQMATVERELEAVRDLAEAGAAAGR